MRITNFCLSLVLVCTCLSTARAQRDPFMTPEKALNELPEGYRHKHVMMPMRDEVRLVTEIFLPPGEGPFSSCTPAMDLAYCGAPRRTPMIRCK